MSEWQELALGEVLAVKHGYAFKGKYFGEGGPVRLVTPGNFYERGGFKDRGLAQKSYNGPLLDEYQLPPESLVVAMTEQSPGLLGSSALIPDDGFVWLHNQRIGLVQIYPKLVDLHFIFHLLNSPSVRDQLSATATGAKVRHTAPRRIEGVRVDMPPHTAQRRIAVVLSAIDNLIEINQRRIELLEGLAGSLYRDWFVNFRFPGHESGRVVESESGMTPEGWTSGRFTDLVEVLSGGTPRTKVEYFWGGDIPFFTPRDASRGSVVLSTERTLTQAGVDACASELFRSRTVFITARGTVGKVALAGRPMAVNQSCYALRGKSGVGQHFVLEMARACAAKLRAEAHGAVFDTITMDTLARFRMPLPPPIVLDAFEAMVSPLYDLVTQLCKSMENLRATRDLLLPRLVTGQLDISDIDLGVLEPAESR